MLTPAARKLTAAGATNVIVTERKEPLTGGCWLEALVLWRRDSYRSDTGAYAYEGTLENAAAMAADMYVLAAQLKTRAPKAT